MKEDFLIKLNYNIVGLFSYFLNYELTNILIIFFINQLKKIHFVIYQLINCECRFSYIFMVSRMVKIPNFSFDWHIVFSIAKFLCFDVNLFPFWISIRLNFFSFVNQYWNLVILSNSIKHEKRGRCLAKTPRFRVFDTRTFESHFNAVIGELYLICSNDNFRFAIFVFNFL